MEYKIVEAWGAMAYIEPETKKVLYRETEDMCQCFWIVKFDTEEKEILSWEEMYPTYEQAERALLGMTEDEGIER